MREGRRLGLKKDGRKWNDKREGRGWFSLYLGFLSYFFFFFSAIFDLTVDSETVKDCREPEVLTASHTGRRSHPLQSESAFKNVRIPVSLKSH